MPAPMDPLPPESPAVVWMDRLAPERRAELLAGIALEARPAVWERLRAALDATRLPWIPTPASLPTPDLEMLTPPPLDEATLRGLSLAAWHRLVALEGQMTMDTVLAVAVQVTQREVLLARLVAHCARLGQLYAEIRRRAGQFFALPLLEWDLSLLRYRFTHAVASLLY